MKADLTSRSSLLALLIVVLLLSSPLVTLAQQISAEVQAKRDAEADLNKPLWIGTGCTVLLLPTLGLLVGSLGPQSYSRGSGGFQVIRFSDQEALGLCVGCAVGCLGPLTVIRMYQPTPPPERFIGKSPEYIEAYSNTYRIRIGRLRLRHAAVGCAIGLGMLAIVSRAVED